MPSTSKTILIADAVAAALRADLPVSSTTEITRTFFYRRFDAAKTTGRKVYVVPRQDAPAGTDGSDRSFDSFTHTLTIIVAERLGKDLVTYDERDDYVESCVDYVTMVRDFLDNPRTFDVIEGMQFVPLTTSERELCDLSLLNNNNVFYSEFEVTLQEI